MTLVWILFGNAMGINRHESQKKEQTSPLTLFESATRVVDMSKVDWNDPDYLIIREKGIHFL